MNQILAIDVGGTKIATGLMEEGLKITNLKITPTSQTDLINQLFGIVSEYQGFEAIGLAIPGPVDVNGLVKRLPNISNFPQTNFGEVLGDKFGVPVTVVNDAKAFAYLEGTKGVGVGKKVVAGVVLGTGTGVGIMMNGEIYEGKDGLAGEFDHLVLPDGKLLREFVKSSRPFKDAEAARSYLKSLACFIVLSFNPDIIVVSGGWSGIAGMEKVFKEVLMNVGEYENQTPVAISKFEYPSLMGAGLLALKKQE